MLLFLEQSLQEILSSSKLDGDAILDIVIKAAAWLAPPRLIPGLATGLAAMDDGARSRLRTEVQTRVRKVFIKGLRCLDVRDGQAQRGTVPRRQNYRRSRRSALYGGLLQLSHAL